MKYDLIKFSDFLHNKDGYKKVDMKVICPSCSEIVFSATITGYLAQLFKTVEAKNKEEVSFFGEKCLKADKINYCRNCGQKLTEE